jgi:hypothetical protein
MKTAPLSVEIPDALMARLLAVTNETGVSLERYVTDALETLVECDEDELDRPVKA